MEAMRRVAAVLVGLWVGLWAGRIVAWIFGLDGALLIGAFVVGGLLGTFGGIETAKTLKPWDNQDRRDAVIGWSVVAGLVALVGVVGLVQSL